MDGFGVNINSLSWKNGELAPALDRLIDEVGAKTWRVVFDMADWEATNDNADPNTPELVLLQRALFQREVPEPVGHAALSESEGRHIRHHGQFHGACAGMDGRAEDH